MPVYVQPPIPAAGYIWTPGYWAWDADATSYYWVPGTWVQPPTVGVLWTPPYWGWNNGVYVFNAGYWGPQVGFYGGVNYGFGYGGSGYEGGRWDNGHFAYNQTVNNFGSTHVTNVYQKNVTVINNNNVSYVGGTGGLKAEPTAEERAVASERHVPPTAAQTSHFTAAAKNPELAASRNGGNPTIAATSRPAQFTGPGVVHATPAAAHVAAPGTAAPGTAAPATGAAASGPCPAPGAPECGVASDGDERSGRTPGSASGRDRSALPAASASGGNQRSGTHIRPRPTRRLRTRPRQPNATTAAAPHPVQRCRAAPGRAGHRTTRRPGAAPKHPAGLPSASGAGGTA